MEKAFHPSFRLNGRKLSYKDLTEVAYSLVKEGEPYQKDAGNFLLDWCDAHAFVPQQTSGSTGAPKKLQLAKQAMVNAALESGQALDLGTETVALCPLSCASIAGRMMLVRAMVLGWNLYLLRPDSRPLDQFPGVVDFVPMVPLQLKNSLSEIHRVKKIIVGGAPVPDELLSELPDGRTEIWETYGMSETSSHIALRQLGPREVEADESQGLPPFKTLDGIHCSLDDRECLVIDAPSRLEAPLVTNDLVTLLSEREFFWLGRADRAINSGGIKLHPEQLERRLSGLLDQPYFLAGLPHPELGNELVLVAEGETLAIPEEDLLGGVQWDSEYERPRKVLLSTKFARTASGKVDRIKTLESLKK
jgi:O-succinylbenzoic acid--CoA ligase